ncbi:MAG TPA: family 1 glycosylhydrolase [Polyangiaceae bacterium]|nr:family 1 glycosylhydrolase [Polyangiaceae bacterium]
MLERRSQLDALLDPSTFLWLTGIEDTFITTPFPKTGRTLDEYELTGHYRHWEHDLELARSLGVRLMRYGIPWHRVNPSPGVWDFSSAEPQLEKLLELGIEPIVDLVHYGTPTYVEQAFLNPDYPELVAEYGARVAERFKGRIHCYTPLNEPRVTAWYCGKLGWWPPYRRGWRGFVAVMLSLCKGIVLTERAIRAVDPEIVSCHVDATDLYESPDAALQDDVARRQEIVFLALDLISGRVHEGHTLYEWLLKQGARPEELAWFRERALDLDVIGINLYPLFSRKVLSRRSGRLRLRMPYATPVIIERLGRMYFERYGRPLLISETASEGSVSRRKAWLEGSLAAVRELRAGGVPLVGYTWWPMFALVTWAYRQGEKPPAYYLKQMGLWDLRDDGQGELERVPTPLVDQFRDLVAAGVHAAGPLSPMEARLHVP